MDWLEELVESLSVGAEYFRIEQVEDFVCSRQQKVTSHAPKLRVQKTHPPIHPLRTLCPKNGVVHRMYRPVSALHHLQPQLRPREV